VGGVVGGVWGGGGGGGFVGVGTRVFSVLGGGLFLVGQCAPPLSSSSVVRSFVLPPVRRTPQTSRPAPLIFRLAVRFQNGDAFSQSPALPATRLISMGCLGSPLGTSPFLVR